MDPLIAKYAAYAAPVSGAQPAADPLIEKYAAYAQPVQYRDVSDEELIQRGMKAKPVDPDAPSIAESLGRGALSGVTLGFDDEIGGAAKALFTDKKYSEARDELRAKKHRAQAENPLAFGIGEVGGGLATAAVPGLGAAKGLAGAIKAGAAVGAGAGLGNSEADLTKGDVGGALADTAKGAALGAGAGAAGYGLAKGTQAIGRKAVDVLGRGAEERVKGGVIRDLAGDQTKAMATPTLKRALTTNREKVLEAAEAFKLPEVARDPQRLLEHSEAALEDVGKQIGDVYKAADAASPGVPLGRIAKSLRNVAEEYERNPATRQMAQQVRRQLDDVVETWMDTYTTKATGRPVAQNGARVVDEQVGDGVRRLGVRVPASEVHGFVSELGKRGFSGAGVDPGTLQVLRQRAWGAVKDELSRHVSEATPAAAKELGRLNRLYSGLSTVVDAASDRAAKQASRGAFSGVDATIGGLGMLTGNPLHAAAAVATKRAVQQGIPLAARAANRALAKLYTAAQSGNTTAIGAAAEEALASGAPRGIVEAITGRLGQAAQQPAVARVDAP